jgi:hypothetical protein
MTATARTHHAEPPAVEPKPDLQLVRDPAGAVISPEDTMPDIGRSAVIGFLIGFVAATAAVTVAGTLGGIRFGASLALGTFVGFWGGGGFGFMMGGTVPLARYLETPSAHPRSGGTETADPPARPSPAQR